MTSKTTTMAVAKPRHSTPTSQPITILQNDSARTYTHVHPFLVLGYYYFRFSALVLDPVSTLFRDLLPLAVLQAAYAVTCLPVTNESPAKPSTAAGKNAKAVSKKAKASVSIPNRIVNAFLALAFTGLASTPTLTIIMVLFGAPLTTHHLQTYLCACHMSLLAVFPLFYVHGVSTEIWKEIAGGLLAFDDVWGAAVGCMIGAWLGAIPIPLDWDREWQKWPITIITGAYGGWLVGKFAGAYLFRGKRIQLD